MKCIKLHNFNHDVLIGDILLNTYFNYDENEKVITVVFSTREYNISDKTYNLFNKFLDLSNIRLVDIPEDQIAAKVYVSINKAKSYTSHMDYINHIRSSFTDSYTESISDMNKTYTIIMNDNISYINDKLLEKSDSVEEDILIYTSQFIPRISNLINGDLKENTKSAFITLQYCIDDKNNINKIIKKYNRAGFVSINDYAIRQPKNDWDSLSFIYFNKASNYVLMYFYKYYYNQMTSKLDMIEKVLTNSIGIQSHAEGTYTSASST